MTLVRKAVNNFIRQHYTPYELIIVNGTDTPVLNNDIMETESMRAAGCRVRELTVTPGANAATMKNIGLKQASGDWAICTDDDDYFHPTRLMYQMAHRRESRPCLLQYQLRLDISAVFYQPDDGPPPTTTIRPRLHMLRMDSGIPGTMLFPRVEPSTGQSWLFDETLETGEYDELLTRMHQRGRLSVVCENHHSPLVAGLHWPLLSVALYHGNNLLPYEQFFTRVDPPGANRTVGLVSADIEQLKVVLQSYNFKIQ